MISPKKRIACISVNRFNTMLCDGVSNSSLELLRYLKNQGHDVAIIVFFTDDPYRRFVFQHLAGGRSVEGRSYTAVLQGIPVHQERLPFNEQALRVNQRNLLKAVIARVRMENVELALTVEDDISSLFAVSVLAIPGGHFFHSLFAIEQYEKLPFFIKLLKKRAVFAVSRFLKLNIEENLGISAEVWYPLFDLDRWAVPRLDRSSASLGFYSGGEHKGDLVINRLVRMRPEWEFTVMGRNYCFPQGKPPANIRALGDISDQGEFYGRVRILLVPSLWPEGFSRVILEAAANGIPVIANAVGGIPEAMGRSGILVDFDRRRTSEADLESLARIYLREADRLLSEPAHYQELSRLARLRAQEYQNTQEALSRRNYMSYFDQ